MLFTKMKLFLASLILASVSLAETSCDPVRLYRKDAKKLTYPGSDDLNVILEIPGDLPNSVIRVDPRDGFLDRFDTANINEGNATHNFNRQIAFICKNQAPGTVPLYRGFSKKGLHMSHINLEKLASAGYTRERSLGYVYAKLPAQENTGFFQVYSIKIKGTEYMTSEIHDEGNLISGTTKGNLFFSMPLESKHPTTTKPKPSTTTKKPSTTTRVTLATSVPATHLDCNSTQPNIGCRFPATPCGGDRCLTTAAHEKGVEAITNYVYWQNAFIFDGVLGSVWDIFKSGWDTITHPKQTARVAVKIFMAANDPLNFITKIMGKIVKNCNITIKADPNQLKYLEQCIIDSTQEVANEIARQTKKKYNQCFHDDAQTMGECQGGAVFQVALLLAGPGELRAAKDLEEISVQIMTNELELTEIAQVKKIPKMLLCPPLPLRKRGLSATCVQDLGYIEKKVVLTADFETPLSSLFRGTYLEAYIPFDVNFPSAGRFITNDAKTSVLGEGETGIAYLTELNGEDIVVKVPKFTPDIERELKIATGQFIIGGSMPNERKALELQGLFIDEEILEDERSVIAMKVAPGKSLENFIRGGGIKTMAEYDLFLDFVVGKLREMWAKGIVHNDLHWNNFMVEKKTGSGGYIVTIIDYGNADVGLSPELFLEGKAYDWDASVETFRIIEEMVRNFQAGLPVL